MVTGIPIGTVGFTLLRLLKNIINKTVTTVGQKVGGNLLGWLVSTLLPWFTPLIAYIVMAGVLGEQGTLSQVQRRVTGW